MIRIVKPCAARSAASASVLAGLLLSSVGCDSAVEPAAPAAPPLSSAGASAVLPTPSAGSKAPTPVSSAAGTGSVPVPTAGTGASAAGTAAPIAVAGSAAPVVPVAGSGGSSEVPVAADGDWPADCEDKVTFAAHGKPVAGDTSAYKVPGQSQYYASFYFKAPWKADEVQGLLFRSKVANKKIVHHWIMYGATSAPTTADGTFAGDPSQPFPNSIQGEAFIAGWAPGSQDMRLPENVGLRMPSGTDATFRLEVHYNNTGADAEDTSGLEFCVTRKKRPQVAATHWLGSPSINIPARAKTDVISTCTPTNIKDGPVHILSISPHMHQTGYHASTVVHRADGQDETIFDQPFDFADQKAVEMPNELLINAGDSITTTCGFQNDTDRAISFGENTEQEMCFFFTLAYPVGALTNGGGIPIPGSEGVNCLTLGGSGGGGLFPGFGF